MMSDNDTSDCSSDSDDERIEAHLKAIPKAPVPAVKAKRVYVRKVPLDENAKTKMVDKLAKARESKAVKALERKQQKAQDDLEIDELKKMKAAGKLKMAKPKVIKKEKASSKKEVHNHYYQTAPPAEDDDEEEQPVPQRKARVKKQPPPPAPPPPPRAPVMRFV